MTYRSKICKLAILMLVGFLSFASATNTYAASEDELYKKALLNTMYNCYKEGEMYTSVTAGGTDGFSSFQNDILRKGKKQSNLYIPTGIGTGNKLDIQSNGTQIGCYELFLGDKGGLSGAGTYGGSMTGLLDLYGKGVPAANSASLPSFLKGMGYTEESSGSSSTKSCLTAKYKNTNISGDDYKTIGKVCWSDADLDGSKDGADLVGSYERNDESNFIVMTPVYDTNGLGLYFNLPDAGTYCETNKIYRPDGYTVSDIKKLATSCGISWTDHYHRDTGEWTNEFYEISISYGSEDAGDSFSKYSMTSTEIHRGQYGTAYSKARSYLSGEGSRQEFTDNDKYELYSLYLSKVYQIQSSNSSDCQSEKPAQAIENSTDGTKYYVHTSNGWCRIAIDESKTSKSTKVSGFSDGQNYVMDTSYDFEGLLNAMFALNIDENTTIDPVPSPDDPNANVEQEISCYDGAGSLGWIVCPILEWLSTTMEDLYADNIEPALKFESILISSDNPDAGAYGAWQTFREFANIFFVLLLLVVIFSQLTGIGIDNYGIKRTLPKLIVMAIIVNVSFILCQLLVDVSNITGSSIKGMLDSVADKTAISVSTIENTQVSGLAYGATGGLELVIAIFAGFVGISAIVGNLGLLLPLLLGLLSGVISILFLFLLLAVRKAAIIVLVAAAPIPLVCYILPNTKKVFDVWWKGLSALLLLYPICGLLIGGGGLASKIILSTGGGNISFFLGISAFVCSIAPIFFIPTLLRGSFKALGNIGATISGVGRSFKAGTLGRFERSDARRRMQTGLANWDPGRMRARAANSRFAKSGVGRILTANMNRSYAMNAQAQKKQRQEDEAAATILAGNIADYRERNDPSYTSEHAYQERMARALEQRDEQTYRAELHEYERHFGASKAANGAMLVNERNLAAGGSGLLSAQNSADFLRRLGADFGSTFAKTPDYSRFLAAGGMDGTNHVRFGVNYTTGAHGELTQDTGAVAGSYLQNVAEHGDIKPEQYAGANAQTLTRQIENGFLTQDVAQQIMANKDLTKGMDAVARLIVAAQAENGTMLTKKEAENILNGTTTKGIDQAHAQLLIRQSPDEVNVVQRFNPYNPEDGQYDSLYVTHGDDNANSRHRGGTPQTPAP